ncbi:MAG TPA: hypothetical protein PLQ63_07050, partial [Propionicimonas sp.]|nr:hypothetical protein [Propionicimonas sp.]
VPPAPLASLKPPDERGRLVLAFSMTPTFAALSAAIQNSVDTAGTGTLIMEEKNAAGTTTCLSTDGGSVATNSATCAGINKYGGNLAMAPGKTVTTTITISNKGSMAASAFTLLAGPCTASLNGGAALQSDFCSKTNLVLTGTSSVTGSTSKTIFSGNLATLNSTYGTTATALNVLSKLEQSQIAKDEIITLQFAVTIGDSSMANAYQGHQLIQPLTWTFGA